jgi:hypothetical protein
MQNYAPNVAFHQFPPPPLKFKFNLLPKRVFLLIAECNKGCIASLYSDSGFFFSNGKFCLVNATQDLQDVASKHFIVSGSHRLVNLEKRL